jgi:hypothetical protein
MEYASLPPHGEVWNQIVTHSYSNAKIKKGSAITWSKAYELDILESYTIYSFPSLDLQRLSPYSEDRWLTDEYIYRPNARHLPVFPIW